jgi:hypothetical protein
MEENLSMKQIETLLVQNKKIPAGTGLQGFFYLKSN